MSYPAHIEKDIFTPLHMENSFAEINKVASNENTAIDYSYHDENGELIDTKRHKSQLKEHFLSPFDGIYSSSGDLYPYL